jgi:hypothetical protein
MGSSTEKLKLEDSTLESHAPTFLSFRVEEPKTHKVNAWRIYKIKLFLFYLVISNNFFFGAMAWSVTAQLLDQMVGDHYINESFEVLWYSLRCISVGFFDSLFCSLGAIVALKFEKCNHLV